MANNIRMIDVSRTVCEAYSCSISADIRMSKAVVDDKTGAELLVDSTGKNDFLCM